ncbi:hypothetical protein BH10PAT3_BH10PAT3_1850 [soil metagenome]
MNKTLPKLALAGAIIAGSYSASRPEVVNHSIEGMPEYVADPISFQEEILLQDTFQDVKKYWLKRQVGVSATKLMVLKGDDTALCSSPSSKGFVFKASDPDSAAYCPTSDTIYISETYVGLVEDFLVTEKASEEAILEFTVSHEAGHAVQHALNMDDFPHNYSRLAQIQSLELQADCYAGEAMGSLYRDDLKDAESFIQGLSLIDISHGTPQQRNESFLSGSLEGPCQPLPLAVVNIPTVQPAEV